MHHGLPADSNVNLPERSSCESFSNVSLGRTQSELSTVWKFVYPRVDTSPTGALETRAQKTQNWILLLSESCVRIVSEMFQTMAKIQLYLTPVINQQESTGP